MKILTTAAAVLAVCSLFSASAAARTGLFDIFRKEEAETEPFEEDFTPKRGAKAPIRKNAAASGMREALPCAAGCGYSWYAVHEKDGKRPAAPAEIPPIGEHGGIYLGPDEKTVYLTFDAGYENGNVGKILDTLKAENVPGAFFILENLVNRNPDLVTRMAEEGHLVCNHTARHRDMTTFGEDAFKEELGRMEAAYRNLTGRELDRYYRPPEGKFTAENLDWAKEMGYSTVLWSFAYADWDNDRQPDPRASLEKILSGTHNGMVLLLHPTSATNAEILPELIRCLKERGYRFGSLDEMTGGGGLGI
jgi:peptidoglycan-N-acetylmuramic acid deacetylase